MHRGPEQFPSAPGMAAEIKGAVGQVPEHGARRDQAHKHQGRGFGVKVRPDDALALTLLDDFPDLPEVIAENPVERGFALRRAAVNFIGEQQAGEGLIKLDQLQMAKKQSADAFQGVPGFGADRGHIFFQPGADQIQHGVQHLGLVPVMAVEGGGHDADLLRHRGHAQALESLAGDNRQRGLRDLVLAEAGVLFGGTHGPLLCESIFTI